MLTRKICDDEIKYFIEEIKEKGFCVIKKYLAEKDVKFLINEALFLIEQKGSDEEGTPLGLQSTIKFDKRLNTVIQYSKDYLEISTTGDHLKIYSEFLNDPFYGLIPSNDPNFILAQANLRQATSRLAFHVDSRLVTPGYNTWSMQGIIALSRKNNLTGGLRVRPGSHLKDYFPDSTKNYSDAEDVDLEPGDMAIFSSQLHHATHDTKKGQNASWALLLTYRSWWCKQQFDLWSMIDSGLLSELNDNQKLILGACSVVPHVSSASPSSRHGYAIFRDNKIGNDMYA